MYSTKSKLTQAVCEKLGFKFESGFIQTMKRKDRIYVKGTLGKPEEFQALLRKVKANGYIYAGRKDI
ncbi:MAG: hypothetical protein RLZZ577_85 [Bacteroidota bacterium]|jgi:hypothetical protein